ncbi:MAG: xanthine dehydrogenase family protein subunit M [Candidatus Tectimicrobiota bacterium]
MNPFTYHTPETPDEVYALLQQYGEDAKLMAGGTALTIMMKQRLVMPETLISLQRLRGLEAITEGAGQVQLGALATHRSAEMSPLIRTHLPTLASTYHHVATVRIRNVATVGGSLAHADPNQDPPVTLLALGAQVELRCASGTRLVPLSDFFTDYYETVLRPDELLTAIQVPLPGAHSGSAHVKFLPRTADDYATVGVAAALRLDPATGACQECRIAMGSVASTPLRALQAEALVRGQQLAPELLHAAGEAAAQQTDPLSDTRGSAEYKRSMTGVFVRRALEQAWQQALAG